MEQEQGIWGAAAEEDDEIEIAFAAYMATALADAFKDLSDGSLASRTGIDAERLTRFFNQTVLEHVEGTLRKEFWASLRRGWRLHELASGRSDPDYLGTQPDGSPARAMPSAVPDPVRSEASRLLRDGARHLDGRLAGALETVARGWSGNATTAAALVEQARSVIASAVAQEKEAAMAATDLAIFRPLRDFEVGGNPVRMGQPYSVLPEHVARWEAAQRADDQTRTRGQQPTRQLYEVIREARPPAPVEEPTDKVAPKWPGRPEAGFGPKRQTPDAAPASR